MTTWHGEGQAPPDLAPIGPAGWARVVVRGAALAAVVYLGLALIFLLRLIERPLFGQGRPVTPWVTQGAFRLGLRIMGIGWRVEGKPLSGRGAMVANHASWLDILTLGACQRLFFVAKAEVAGWAGIGWPARAVGTVFIARDPKQAKAQQRLFEDRLRAGHRLVFFPEGTSTDGRRVLPFKPTLFAAFYSHGLDHVMQIQPVSVAYHAPKGEDARFYGWWGSMAFAPHLLQVLAARRQGSVVVRLHPPVAVDAFASRKELAAHCEAAVRAGLAAEIG